MPTWSRLLDPSFTPLTLERAAGDRMFAGDEGHYLAVGRDALRCIATALLAADASEPQRILDLPCGHGRVLRWLRAAWPTAEITACDLDHDGVRFCAERLGARPLASSVDPRDLDAFDAFDAFDLIFCGSLLTHLDAEGWQRWVEWFADHLTIGGVLVLTFHGRWVRHRLEEGVDYRIGSERARALVAAADATGFGYADYPDQAGFGVSLCHPQWVVERIVGRYGLRVVSLCEMQWDRHQDVVGVQRFA